MRYWFLFCSMMLIVAHYISYNIEDKTVVYDLSGKSNTTQIDSLNKHIDLLNMYIKQNENCSYLNNDYFFNK